MQVLNHLRGVPSLRACSGSVSRHFKICDQLMAFCVVSAFLAPFKHSQILLLYLFFVWIPHCVEDTIALPLCRDEEHVDQKHKSLRQSSEVAAACGCVVHIHNHLNHFT